MELFFEAVARIKRIFEDGHPAAIVWSGGKDSSVILSIALEAASQHKAEGGTPKVVVTNSNTGIESPEIEQFVDIEMLKISQFAQQKGLDVEVRQATPSLGATWAVRVLSGRGLPSFPGTSSDCSTDFKVTPMRRLRKAMFAEHKGEKEVITIIGTRFQESASRGAAMRHRSESWETPVRNKDGDLVLSAIANWTGDDVWTFVAYARSGHIETYSDFEDLFRLYADGGGTSCAVVSDTILEANAAASKKSGGCGARFGCYLCTRVANDSSLAAMIEGDPKRYGYMTPLNAFRECLIANHWDWNKRMWVGRTIDDDGMIAIRPDTYSPAYVLDLLRFMLTIQMDERRAARRLGIAPRFTLVTLKQLAAIDALWSLQGYHKSFQAVREWVDIVDEGKRYPLPTQYPVFKRSSPPAARWFHVGDHWNQGERYFGGLRNPTLEAVSEDSGCMGTRTLKSGRVVMDVESDHEFDFDEEGLELAFGFELEHMLERNQAARDGRGLTEGYLWWAGMGTMLLSPRQISLHDEILSRTLFKERNGLAGANYDLGKLLSRSMTETEVKKHKKAASLKAALAISTAKGKAQLNPAQIPLI